MSNKEKPTLEELDAIADKIRGGNSNSRSDESIEANWMELLGHFPVKGVSRSQAQIWYRARVCETSKGYSNLDEMIYPPNGSNSYGRASLPNQRILYGSWNRTTALREIGAQKGDFVQLIAYRVIPGVEFFCAVIGEIENFNNCGKSVLSDKLSSAFSKMALDFPSEFQQYLYVDSVCAEIFRRTVNRQFEYKTSAVLANLLLKMKGGLMYPSIEARNAINLVIRAEEFNQYFEVINTRIVKVEHSFGHGVYQIKDVNASYLFEENGHIRWGEGRFPDSEFSFSGGWRVTEQIKGWRVPREP